MSRARRSTSTLRPFVLPHFPLASSLHTYTLKLVMREAHKAQKKVESDVGRSRATSAAKAKRAQPAAIELMISIKHGSALAPMARART